MPQEIEKYNNPIVPAPKRSVNLSMNNPISLDGMSDEAATEIERQHASNMLALSVRANQAKIDVGALAGTLETLNVEAVKATEANVSITIEHNQKSSIGETKIILGNTAQAASGRGSLTASFAKQAVLIVGIVMISLIFVTIILKWR